MTLDLVFKSGETSTPKGKEGLASIAIGLLDEGTSSRDALQIAGELAEISSSLGAAGELESSTVSLTTLTRHLNPALDLYTDVILNASFPEKQLERLKVQRLAQLKARADDAEHTAEAIFPRLIYGPDHSYGRPELGTASSVRSISRDDVVAFCKKIMVPAQRSARGRRRRSAGFDHRGPRVPARCLGIRHGPSPAGNVGRHRTARRPEHDLSGR